MRPNRPRRRRAVALGVLRTPDLAVRGPGRARVAADSATAGRTAGAAIAGVDVDRGVLRVDSDDRRRRREDRDAPAAAAVPAAPAAPAFAAASAVSAVANAAAAAPEERAIGVLAGHAVAAAPAVLTAAALAAALAMQIDRRQAVRCVAQIHRDGRRIDDSVCSGVAPGVLVAVGARMTACSGSAAGRPSGAGLGQRRDPPAGLAAPR